MCQNSLKGPRSKVLPPKEQEILHCSYSEPSAKQQQMGSGWEGDLQSLPSSPRRPSRIYRDWHQTTFPPPSTQTQTHRRSQNMLPQSAGRLDGAISEVLLGDLWPLGNSEGRERTGGNLECGGKRGFINLLESSLRLFRPPYNSILLNKRLRWKFTNVKMESVCHKA